MTAPAAFAAVAALSNGIQNNSADFGVSDFQIVAEADHLTTIYVPFLFLYFFFRRTTPVVAKRDAYFADSFLSSLHGRCCPLFAVRSSGFLFELTSVGRQLCASLPR